MKNFIYLLSFVNKYDIVVKLFIIVFNETQNTKMQSCKIRNSEYKDAKL